MESTGKKAAEPYTRVLRKQLAYKQYWKLGFPPGENPLKIDFFKNVVYTPI